MNLTPHEILALIRHHLGLLDPAPDRLVELANQYRDAIQKQQKARVSNVVW